MTLPIEKARSLRWGWEFLWELKTATNLTALQRATILIILDHYPSTSETTRWAEDQQGSQIKPPRNVPIKVDRGPVTFAKRMWALSAASRLFHSDMLAWDNLSPHQTRAHIDVCRHFPTTDELNRVVVLRLLRKPTQTSHDFARRAKEAIDRSIANCDGIPAETVIAKLKSKLANARKPNRS